MQPMVLELPGNEDLASALAAGMAAERGRCFVRRFPDGETYARVDSEVAGRDVVLAGSLVRPDPQLVPLALLAGTARELGARRVGLVTPYLPYMRQDHRFNPGEAVSAGLFARLVSSVVDWLVTVDPHLHRLRSLDEVYPIPTRAVAAAPALAAWIRAHVEAPLVVGPDAESAQWAEAVAAELQAPSVVLTKERSGDREVRVSAPELGAWRGRNPVLIDDIASTGRTLIDAAARLFEAGFARVAAAAVHGVFADGALGELRAAGLEPVVATNTIPNPASRVDVVPLLAAATSELLGRPTAARAS